MRRRSANKLPLIFGVFVGMMLLILFVRFLSGLSSDGPEDVVEEFYHYEQEGDFGSAWELFHPVMQERFAKNAYVTERSHIYMGHYGVTTFKYEIIEKEEVQKWKMAKGGDEFPNASKVTVEQTFKSKFGSFTIKQDVYAVQHEEEWRIVWDFK